ncbi:ATP-binding cassette domain-containing protein [Eubacteriales bacterium OttesenSCG-928-N13]|nr:ATP-binding cassette domain-containing protein [Eubacteriales bacterium OttesenSCG-928-N13]
MIAIEGLTKIYGSGDGMVTALNRVDLTINKGDIHGIIGMSGAGKSTLIRCINRLDTPTEGRILIDDQDVLTLSGKELSALRKRVSMIFQQFNLLMQKNVSRNVRYPLEIAGVPRAEANKRVKELLEIVGLTSKENAYPSQLSGGQKQRVAIARALASNPDVLLCDEATSALDPMTTQSILALLQDINQRMGITIVIITHEMAVIRQICDRVTIIDNGSIVEEGSVDEVFTHTKSTAGRRLFGVVKAENQEKIGDAVRIVFDGDERHEPLLSQFILKTGIAVSIISADMNRIGGKSYGQMMLKMPTSYEQRATLIEGLREMGLTVEEVHDS